MAGDRWAELDEIFDRAHRLGPEERAAFLAEACHGDPDLRVELEALLASHDRGSTLLDRRPPARPAPARDLWDELTPRPVSRGELDEELGTYRLGTCVGHGGMASVFEARDTRAPSRRVAVKVVHPDLATESLTRRLHREARILARLDHPGIARLLDHGTSPRGHAYLVMEFVEGAPIDDFVRERKLDTARVVKLMIAICGAVGYAHGEGVVHRDLKPRNILVGATGEPKVLDFGISKLLEDPAATALAESWTSTRYLTPGYASPEQIRSETIAPSSDVFSLGVVAAELITGRHPFGLRELSPPEVLLRICDPAPPVLTTREDRAPLPTPLEAVLRRALTQSADRRTATAGALREELRRYLAGSA